MADDLKLDTDCGRIQGHVYFDTWRTPSQPKVWLDIDGEGYDDGSAHVTLDVERTRALIAWLAGALAQLEERRALNAEASGSNPERATR